MKVILKNSTLVFASENSDLIKPSEVVQGRMIGTGTFFEKQANNTTYTYNVSEYKTVKIDTIGKSSGYIIAGLTNGSSDFHIIVKAGLAKDSEIDVSFVDKIYINIDTMLGNDAPKVTKGELLERIPTFITYTKESGYITTTGVIKENTSNVVSRFNTTGIQRISLCVQNNTSNGLCLLVGFNNDEFVSSIPMVNNNSDYEHVAYDIVEDIDVSAFDEVIVNGHLSCISSVIVV